MERTSPLSGAWRYLGPTLRHRPIRSCLREPHGTLGRIEDQLRSADLRRCLAGSDEGWSDIAAEQGGQDIRINPPAVSKQSHQHSAGHREVVLVEHVDRVTDPDGHQARVRVVGNHLRAISLTVEAHPRHPAQALVDNRGGSTGGYDRICR